MWAATTRKVVAKAVSPGNAPAGDEDGDPGGNVGNAKCILSVSWHPTGNGLLVMAASGQVCVHVHVYLY